MGKLTPKLLGSELTKLAILMLPSGKAGGLSYGPVMPGPDIKNPNTSLY